MNLDQNLVAYYRVSTEEQGNSGLGLQSQKSFIQDFIVKSNSNLVAEFVDIESGKNNSREQFNKAIALCNMTNSTLIAYDITRISRGGFSMMASLEASGVKFISATNPYESDFAKSVQFVVAKEEADRIARNTRKALQAIKQNIATNGYHISKSGNRITKLGSGVPISDVARENSIKTRTLKAKNDPNNKRAGAFIVNLVNQGQNFSKITKMLNDNGFLTSRGNQFSQVQTKRLYKRFANV